MSDEEIDALESMKTWARLIRAATDAEVVKMRRADSAHASAADLPGVQEWPEERVARATLSAVAAQTEIVCAAAKKLLDASETGAAEFSSDAP